MQQNTITQTETTSSIFPIESESIIEHGESPTSIILASAILIAIVLGAVKDLVKIILMLSK